MKIIKICLQLLTPLIPAMHKNIYNNVSNFYNEMLLKNKTTMESFVVYLKGCFVLLKDTDGAALLSASDYTNKKNDCYYKILIRILPNVQHLNNLRQ